jgi:hypothetical protein
MWSHEGSQVILDLRVLVLSKVWHPAHKAYRQTRPQPAMVKPASQRVFRGRILNKTA